MPNARSRWVEGTPSRYPWEREALAVPREGLPDHEPGRAWRSLQVITQGMSANEASVLVLEGRGLLMTEIMGHKVHWTRNLSSFL